MGLTRSRSWWERHVVKEAKGQRLPSAGLTTSRREALALYREILRTTRLFTWTNEQGVPWRDLLRDSARMEYEQARYETDPEVFQANFWKLHTFKAIHAEDTSDKEPAPVNRLEDIGSHTSYIVSAEVESFEA